MTTMIIRAESIGANFVLHIPAPQVCDWVLSTV